MAKQTKLNFIELIKDVDEKTGELNTKVYFTPKYIPFSKLMALTEKLESMEEKTEVEAMNEMFKVVAEDIYNGQFTVEELQDGLHAPEAVATLQEQIAFISEGKLTEANEARLKELLK